MKKSEKLKSTLKGIGAFCSYLFWPRWGRSKSRNMEGKVIKIEYQNG